MIKMTVITRTAKTMIEKSFLAVLIISTGLVFVKSVPYGMASHEDEGISNYLWSRAGSDGHRSLLICPSGSNADRCDIPYDLARNINNMAGSLSKAQINSEESNAESNINSFNVYIDVVEYSSTFDVRPFNLGTESTARYSYDAHCTQQHQITWWWCLSEDSHFVDFDIRIDTNSAFNFGASEVCNGSHPTTWDLEKVTGHELFHMFGVDHSSSVNSITYNGGHVCDVGKYPASHDRSVVNAKYGPGVT